VNQFVTPKQWDPQKFSCGYCMESVLLAPTLKGLRHACRPKISRPNYRNNLVPKKALSELIAIIVTHPRYAI